jgi:hypothetical protein
MTFAKVWFPPGADPIPDGQDPSNKQGYGYFDAWSVKMLKQGIIHGIGNDQTLRCFALALASLETSYGKNMPQQDEQARRGKWGNDMQENCNIYCNSHLLLGFSRMNTGMIRQVGESVPFNEQSVSAHQKCSSVLVKVLNKFGIGGMVSYHRGGQTAYDHYRKSGQTTNDVQLYWRLVGKLSNSCLLKVNFDPSTNPKLPWIDSSKFGLGEI